MLSLVYSSVGISADLHNYLVVKIIHEGRIYWVVVSYSILRAGHNETNLTLYCISQKHQREENTTTIAEMIDLQALFYFTGNARHWYFLIIAAHYIFILLYFGRTHASLVSCTFLHTSYGIDVLSHMFSNEVYRLGVKIKRKHLKGCKKCVYGCL